MPVEGVRSSMSELDPVAKRIYNVHPDPVRLVLDDGSDGLFHLSSAEFFQREFQAEGRRVDDDADASYRLVTGEGDESVLLGRKGPDDDAWRIVGEVVGAERAGGDEPAHQGESGESDDLDASDDPPTADDPPVPDGSTGPTESDG
jgi:hypothetical protein